MPFFHLLNFFDSAAYTGGDNPSPVGTSPQLHRILEYLRVPSPFVGCDTQLNPTASVSGAHTAGTVGIDCFNPPFNWLSRYWEPGRINLNTIFSQTVWQGLMNQFPDPTYDWDAATPPAQPQRLDVGALPGQPPRQQRR